MAQSREDRVFNALSPQEGDSPIFKTRHGVDWSQHKKVQKASRGIWEVQEELFEKTAKREFLDGTVGRDGDLKQIRLKFWPILASFVILSTIASFIIGMGISEGFGIYYWWGFLIALFITSVGSVLFSLYRTYIDLYPRAWWRYHRKVKKETREPIDSVEALSYHISVFNPSQFEKDSVIYLTRVFGQFAYFEKYRDEVDEYVSALSSGIQKVKEKGQGSPEAEAVLEMLKEHQKGVEPLYRKLVAKEAKVWERARMLAEETLPAYKQRLQTIADLLSELETDSLGEVEDITALLKRRKSDIEEAVIEEVKKLKEAVATIYGICTQIRDQKRKDRGEPDA